MKPLNAREANTMDGGGASFSLRNRLQRAVWLVTWLLLARWTPPPLHRWRCFLLRLFGAKIGKGVRVYGSVSIWFPANLEMGELSWLGPSVRCYNQGMIVIGRRAIVSQYAYLCASTHDVSDPHFQLQLRPITIGSNAWIAADAFVGPGVIVGEGAVLGARAAAFTNLEPWTIHRGNPAQPMKSRTIHKMDE